MTSDHYVYVVLVQPEGDGDPLAQLRGVFPDLESARRAASGWKCQIIGCPVGAVREGAGDGAFINAVVPTNRS